VTGQQRTYCSAGDCITVTESTTHPNVIHIGTQHDGQAGRAQLTVTRGEYDAFVAGIKAEERERIRQLAIDKRTSYTGPEIDWSWQPFADLIGNPS
jgi:hypothetical protein